MKVKKAIIPAAGLGTRMMPSTKAVPKEMLTIVDKPVIQYVVEEAAAAGITDILIVIGKDKKAIEEHFSRDLQKEFILLQKGKKALVESLQTISNLATIHFVFQQEMNGLGDAIRYGQQHIGKEPFAVLLGDSIMESQTTTPILNEMVELFEKHQASIVAINEIPSSLVHKYGVMDGAKVKDHPKVYKVKDWIEKPSAEEAPSNLAVAGRYIFTPSIFDLLKDLPPGINNEIQLTDAMRLLLHQEDMYAFQFNGKRHDIGNKLDFIKTNLLFGLKDAQLGPELQEWIKGLK